MISYFDYVDYVLYEVCLKYVKFDEYGLIWVIVGFNLFIDEGDLWVRYCGVLNLIFVWCYLCGFVGLMIDLIVDVIVVLVFGV